MQLHLPLREQQSVLPLEAPVIFLDIDEVDVLELVLVMREGLDGALHEHLAVGLIHAHHTRVVDRVLLRVGLLAQEVVVDLVLVVLVVVVDVLPQLVEQEDELLLLDGLLDDEVGVGRRRLQRNALISGHLEEIVELLESGLVGHEAAVDHELRVLAETHRVELGFREAGPQLREPGLVVLFQYNGL